MEQSNTDMPSVVNRSRPAPRRDFGQFGSDAQDMILGQLHQIDLEKIGPKSIAHVGKSLIALIKQSHQYQEESDLSKTRENWIAIREISMVILTEILDKYTELSENGDIPEWERASVLVLLREITKVAHEEDRRDKLAQKGNGMVLDDDTLDKLLGLKD
jgi:hypothetical protein